VNHFLALRLDDDSRDRLALVAGRLQAWQLPASWLHPDDYHLTLVFLGDLAAEEAQFLPHAIDLVAGSLRRPALRFTGLGASGGRSEPRAVFAGIADAEAACAGMHRDLSEAVDQPAEPRFAPHVTLCRPHFASQRELGALGPERSWPRLLEANGLAEWGDCATTALVLYVSRPESGTRYQPLASWPLVAA
jgi:2'-5' RNA ligase